MKRSIILLDEVLIRNHRVMDLGERINDLRRKKMYNNLLWS